MPAAFALSVELFFQRKSTVHSAFLLLHCFVEVRGRLVPKNFHLPFKHMYEALNIIK